MTLRLQKIIQAIPKVEILCDVGCDHGYIGLGAMDCGLAQKVIFVDVSRPSLQKAQNACANKGIDCCQFVCQDGLKSIFCNCAVIAGMGGLEIISILTNAQYLPQYLVLQPMKNQVELRKFVSSKYNIVTDVKFFDGKFYDLIYLEKSDAPLQLTEKQLQFGKTNLDQLSQDFIQFLQIERQKYTQILTQCNDIQVQRKLQGILDILANI